MFHADYEPSTWIPYIVIILDFLKGVAWPLAALGIAALFSKEIKQILPRIKQLGPTGVHLESPEQEGSKPDDVTAAGIASVSLGPLIDPVAANFEENTNDILENIPEVERVPRLVRALAFQQLNKSFALAYHGIFGSQIRALRELNVRNISRSQADDWFKELQKENSAFAEWNLDEYLNYLFSWQLVEESMGLISITETGRNFLRFLVEHKLSEDRPN